MTGTDTVRALSPAEGGAAALPWAVAAWESGTREEGWLLAALIPCGAQAAGTGGPQQSEDSEGRKGVPIAVALRLETRLRMTGSAVAPPTTR